MAEIIQNEGGGKKGGKKRPRKHSAHIDMTPMVDLMCLLITFFMLTTAFSKPNAMEITLPNKVKDPNQEKTQVPVSRTFNLILGEDNKVYYYPGVAGPGVPLQETTFGSDGIRMVLLDRNKELFDKIEDIKTKFLMDKKESGESILREKVKKAKAEDDKGPIVLLKAHPKSKYRNLVDIIDEMLISNIGTYAVATMSPAEMAMYDAKRGTASSN